MREAATLTALRDAVGEWRAAGQRVALVPTMGNLHEGHLQLVDRARELADRVVVSIFVNPTQFGPGEDLDNYPRTLEADREKLCERRADLLFTPGAATVYPHGEPLCLVSVPGISEELCGASRPGHFTGVATVVARLLNMAQPEVAVFGEKDFQQLVVIRRMVDDLFLPVQIEGVPTCREQDGLAMSSRNQYLDAAERARAPLLYRVLCELREALADGATDYARLEQEGAQTLVQGGMQPDYVAIRRAADLAPPTPCEGDLVILGAARLGRARLIDNVRLSSETA